ncbi:MAG: ADP-ribosylation factor-like protein [Candidatus Helarchaeota archaeon]
MKKYKITIVGPAGSGKTTMVHHIWKGKSFNEIKVTPTTQFEFTEKPIKIGDITISAWDLGGQKLLLDEWLSEDSPYKCFKSTSGILMVLDFSNEFQKYRYRANREHEKTLQLKIDEAKSLILRAIKQVRRQNPDGYHVKIAILFNKWDLINDHNFHEDLKLEFGKFFQSILSGPKNGIEYKGCYITSNIAERYSPKKAFRAILPHSVAIKKIFSNFLRRYQDHDAEYVYFATLNEDFLEIETHQHPKEFDYQTLVISLLKSMYPAYHVSDTFSKLSYVQDEELKFNEISLVIQYKDTTFRALLVQLTNGLSLFALSDIDDSYLFEKLFAKLRKTLKVKDAIYA